MDIAEIGLKAESADVALASKRLDQLGKSAYRAETASGKMESAFSRMRSSALSFAGGLVAGIAGFAALTRTLSTSIREARAYGKAIAEVNTLLSDTSGSDRMSASVLRLSRQYGQAPVEQARALYQAISAGAGTAAQSMELLHTANRVSIGGLTQVATAVDILTTATNAYSDSGLTSADAADILFVGMRAGKTTIEELSKTLGRTIPTAKAVGIEFHEVVAAVAALTTQGQSTEMAVTGISASMLGLLKPAKEAQDLARALGIEFNAATAASMGFANFMEMLVEKTGGSQEQLTKLFGSAESLRAVLTLAGSGGEKFNEILGQMEQRAGAADAAFAVMANTADFALNRLGEGLRSELIGLGDSLLSSLVPAMRAVTENLSGIVTAATATATALGTILVARAGAALLTWLRDSTVRMAEHARGAMAGAAADALWAEAKVAGAAAAVSAAKAQAADNMVTLEAVALARQQATQELALANQQALAAQRTIAATKATGHLSGSRHAARVATDLLTAAEARRSVALGRLAVLGQQQVRVEAQLATSATALAAAQGRLTVASAAAAVALRATSIAAAAGAVTARVLSGAMALLGGPIGVAVTALAGLVYWINAANVAQRERLENEFQAIGSLAQYTKAMEEARIQKELLTRAEEAGRTPEEQSTVENYARAVKELAAAEAELTQQTLNGTAAMDILGSGSSRVQGRISELRGVIAQLTVDSNAYAAALYNQENGFNRLLQAMGGLSGFQVPAGLQALFALFRTGAEDVEKVAKTLKLGAASNAEFSASVAAEVTQLEARRIELTQGTEAALLYTATQAAQVNNADMLTAKTREEVAALALLRGEVAALEKAQTDASGAAAKAEAARQQAAAKAEKAAEDMRRKEHALMTTRLQFLQATRALAAQLGGPLAVATRKYVDELENVGRMQELSAITAEEAAERIALLTEEFKRSQEEIAANTEEARWLQGVLDEFNNTGMNGLVREIERVGEALSKALKPDEKEALLAYMEKLKQSAREYRQQGLERMVGATQEVLGAIQGLSKEGSNAYKALGLAQHALNLVMAIGGIVNQANGDPYTAWARMAAMAATMASYIGQNFGGANSFTDTASQRQETQGRGTVLGDAEAQSESIANAVQITAYATTDLVGINQGMLRALRAIQNGIGSATGMLARGSGQSEFSPIPGDTPFRDPILGNIPGGSFFGGRALDPFGVLGGSSKITDQGIAVLGGLLQDVAFGAYQEVQTRSWAFGSRRTSEEIVDAPDSVAAQFRLIMDSIVNTVREAALALGLLPAEIEAALATYRVEEMRISLMDLSAEEQQAELTAVFGSIFDGLAEHVVPFVEQFQRVGEGLGETLVRVATGVQVMQEAILQLGFALDETDPETFAQISESLIEMVGGLEEFITGMGDFVDAFATDEHKFEVMFSSLTRALEQVGLTVPESRAAMWELMTSLDATTESGREQIAALLRLTSVSDAYYQMLERAENPVNALADLMAQIALEREGVAADASRLGFGALALALRDIADAMDATLEAATALGASERQLNAIRELASERAAFAMAQARAQLNTTLEGFAWTESLAGMTQLQASIAQLNRTWQEAADSAAALGATQRQVHRIEMLRRANLERLVSAAIDELGYTELGQIERQITAMEESARSAANGIGGVVDGLGVLTNAAQEFRDAILIDDQLSGLSVRDQYNEAMRQLRETGDAGTARRAMELLRELTASGADFRAGQAEIFGLVRDPVGDAIGGAAESPELAALRAERDRLLAERDAANRASNALTVLEQLVQLARLSETENFEQIAARLGISDLGLLAGDLGLSSVEELFAMVDRMMVFDPLTMISAGDQAIIDALNRISFRPDPAAPVVDELPPHIRALLNPDSYIPPFAWEAGPDLDAMEEPVIAPVTPTPIGPGSGGPPRDDEYQEWQVKSELQLELQHATVELLGQLVDELRSGNTLSSEQSDRIASILDRIERATGDTLSAPLARVPA